MKQYLHFNNVLTIVSRFQCKYKFRSWYNAHKLKLWKKSLNSDGHQFHQFQQNDQSPLIFNLFSTKRTWPTTLETQVLVWYRHKEVAGLNQLMGSQPSPLDNWDVWKFDFIYYKNNECTTRYNWNIVESGIKHSPWLQVVNILDIGHQEFAI